VFENIFGNIYFLVVVIGTFAAQIILTYYFPLMTRTTALKREEWGACIAIGATPLGIAALLKLTPEKWLDKVKVEKFVDENKAVEEGGILKMYNDTKKIKVTDLKKKAINKEPNEDNDF